MLTLNEKLFKNKTCKVVYIYGKPPNPRLNATTSILDDVHPQREIYVVVKNLKHVVFQVVDIHKGLGILHIHIIYLPLSLCLYTDPVFMFSLTTIHVSGGLFQSYENQ